MKDENVKLVLGLGLGILIGGAIGAYLVADKKKLREEFDHLVEEVKGGAKTVYDKMKPEAKAANVEEEVKENV